VTCTAITLLQHVLMWHVINVLINSANKAEVMRSFGHSVNSITDKRGNEHWPNLAVMGKGWPPRSD